MENVNIPEPVLPSVVKRFIESFIKDNSLENAKIVSKPAVSKGNNFMGIIDRLTVAGVKNEKDIEITLIVKVPLSDEALNNIFSMCRFYDREIFIYEDIASLYEDIQRNVPEAAKFKFPKCYFTHSAKSEQCIILADLLKEDFRVHHRLKRVDFEHASLALEAIGKMHAISFYMQENMKEKFRYLKESLNDVVSDTFLVADGQGHRDQFHDDRLEEFLSVLDCEEHKEKMRRFGSNFHENLSAACLPGPYTVLTHGDCWISNMLFKYENDKPVDVRLLDYQMSRFATPILDIAYFISCCTDGEFRKAHYDDILEVYYDALSKHLSYFSMKASDVYPRRVFYEQLKEYFAYGISCAILNLSNGTRDEVDAANMAEVMNDFVNEQKFKNKSSNLFKERANDFVRDCISYGYL